MKKEEYIRKMRVAELNRILPMLRVTLKRRKKCYHMETQISSIQEAIAWNTKKNQHLKGVLEIEIDNDIKERFEKIIQTIDKKNADLNLKLTVLETKKDELEEKIVFEEKLFECICRSICESHDSFLNPEDIKPEFLNEYLYFIALVGERLGSKMFFKCISLKDFFSEEAYDKLKKLLEEKYGEEDTFQVLNFYNIEKLVTNYLK